MYEVFRHTLEQKIKLTNEDFAKISVCFKPKRLRKKHFLLQDGDVCRNLAFIERGTLYSYSADEKGIQHVIQFGFEGGWIADLYSFLTGEPSRLNIEALEECELLMISKEQQEKLLKEVPAYETYTRLLMQNAYVALQRRVEGTLGRTAEEKYARLLEKRPELIARLPQHLIASYLGITRETLSRIRSQSAS